MKYSFHQTIQKTTPVVTTLVFIELTIFIFIQMRKLQSQILFMFLDIVNEFCYTNVSTFILIRAFKKFLKIKFFSVKKNTKLYLKQCRFVSSCMWFTGNTVKDWQSWLDISAAMWSIDYNIMREKNLLTQNGTTPVLQYNLSFSQKCRWGASRQPSTPLGCDAVSFHVQFLTFCSTHCLQLHSQAFQKRLFWLTEPEYEDNVFLQNSQNQLPDDKATQCWRPES